MTTKYTSSLVIPEDRIYSLRNKGLKFDSESDIAPYVAELEALENVECVDISGNTISPAASKALADALAKHKDTIKEINFQDIYVSRDRFEIPQSLEHLFAAALSMPNLSVFNLSDNALGQDTIDILEKFISKVQVEHLILSNNGLGPFSGARIGKALYANGQNRSKTGAKPLLSFWCGRNRLENGSCEALALGFKANPSLQEIKLYQNGIRPQGLSTLITYGLGELKELKVVDLQDNTMTLPGSMALKSVLANWPELIELNLNDCLMKPKGSLAVVGALSQLSDSKIQILRLQYNELDEESLDLLSRSVANFAELSSIELNGNRFEEDSDSLAKIQDVFEQRGLGEVDELDDLEELDSEDEDEDEDDEDDAQDEDDDIKERLASLEDELKNVSI